MSGGVDYNELEENLLSETLPSNKKKGGIHGATVSFHDITYQVQIKERRKKITKTILNKVSGVFKPGVNAILGPTGGGKTTLLDVLAARKDPQGLSGVVLIDGKEPPRNFRLIAGYVVQDDFIMGTLSVRENLMFSAALRLPQSVSNKERTQRVEDIIEELGLNDCANTKIGNQFIRGVSGGERKRTNIGMELVTQPGVLFLDEPTTGLDASTAGSVILHLAKLSMKGRTIIFSIHQPRFSIFRHFDYLHLLSLGETVYHGSAVTALEYFSKIGFDCEEHNNPADFFLDTIIANERVLRKRESQTKDLSAVESGTNSLSVEKLSETFGKSEEFRVLEKECQHILPIPKEKGEKKADWQKIEYATTFFKQLMVVSQRAAKNVIRDPSVVFSQSAILLIFAILGGLLYFQMDTSRPSGIQNRIGAFLFLSLNQIFANVSAIEIFIMERAIFVHETASGFYRVSPYFFGKVFSDLLPLRLLPVLLFGTVTYWMMGLKPEFGAFVIFLLTMILTSFVATGVAFAMSSTFSQLSIATVTSSLIFMSSMILGGVLVNIDSLPEWIQWIQYFSIFRYTINALSVNEFVGMEFCFSPGVDCISGEAYLESQGIKHTAWGLWQNHVALSILLLIFFTVSYIQLRRLPKNK